MDTQSSGSASQSDFHDTLVEINKLAGAVLQLRQEVDGLVKIVMVHENELKDRKVITNSYTDAVLSKIEILKNMITKNVGDADTFISPHLLEVQSIEEQIKQTGKISDKQFKTLNEIYLKQKRI